MIVVSDTSPLSGLLIIKQLNILEILYKAVVIPPRVHAELLQLQELGEDISAYEHAEWIKVETPNDLKLVQSLVEMLDEGEAEAIALAKELEADYLIVDERRGWKIAKSLNVNAIGLIGVLLKAKSEGVITLVLPIVDRLIAEAGFWISEDFYNQIKSLAKE